MSKFSKLEAIAETPLSDLIVTTPHERSVRSFKKLICPPPAAKTEPADSLAALVDSGQAGGTVIDASVAILQTQTPAQTAIAKPSLVAVLEFAGYVDHSVPVSAFQGTPQIAPLAFSPRVPSLHPVVGNGALSDSSCLDLTGQAGGIPYTHVMHSFEHDFYKRDDDLSHCKICGGAEGSLPTLCPGRRMTVEEQDAVYANRLNFSSGPMIGAQWWVSLL